jgi:hypothetical protein
VKDVVDRIGERAKVPNPYHIGEICILLPKDNPDLRGKAGYWGVVSHVGEYSCTLQTWDGDYTVKIEQMKSLKLLDEDCFFMQQLCVRLRQLHQVSSREEAVDWLLQGLGILPNRICHPCTLCCWWLLKGSTTLCGDSQSKLDR